MDTITEELTERIQIFAVGVQAPDSVVAQYQLVLTPEEVARAARFRFRHLQRSFIIARGVLRILIGRYLHTTPQHVELCYGAKGKPRLAVPARIQFNVSHSNDLALFAFALDREIGIDVEHIRPLSDMQEIASRFFCADETAELMGLPPDQHEQAFYRCWTRKEAYIKAIGDGLSVPLDNFRVTLRQHDPVRFVHLAHDTVAAEGWTLLDLRPAPQYAAALAYRGALLPIGLLPPVTPAELLHGKFPSNWIA